MSNVKDDTSKQRVLIERYLEGLTKEQLTETLLQHYDQCDGLPTELLNAVRLQGQNVEILQPALDVFLVVAITYAILSNISFDNDYFNAHRSLCPLVEKLQSLLFGYVPSLQPQVKRFMVGYCSYEDAVYTFYIDAWVRSIVSQTDNWVLLFSQSQAAYVASVGLPLVLGPFMACLYATAATAAFVLDGIFPQWGIVRVLSQQLCHLRWLLLTPLRLMAFVGRSACFSLSFMIGFLDMARRPVPAAVPRRSLFTVVPQWKRNEQQCRSSILSLGVGLWMCTVLLRYLCIWLHFGGALWSIVRKVAEHTGFAEAMRAHQQKFSTVVEVDIFLMGLDSVIRQLPDYAHALLKPSWVFLLLCALLFAEYLGPWYWLRIGLRRRPVRKPKRE